MAGELTIVIAKIFSVMAICLGLGAIFDKNLFQDIVKDTFKNKGVSMLFGIISLVFGMLIVTYHNIWNGWAVIVTIMGWAGIIKGALILIFPTFLEDSSMKVFKGGLSKIIPYTTILMGLIIGYLALVVG